LSGTVEKFIPQIYFRRDIMVSSTHPVKFRHVFIGLAHL